MWKRWPMSNSDESKYLQYLPGIYQPGKGDKRPIFLGKFLKAFEKVLSGIQETITYSLNFLERDLRLNG